MTDQNLDDLLLRLEKQDTEASLAIYDMCEAGSIYQNQNNFDFYTVNKFTGVVMRLERFKGVWQKQVGLSFKFMYSTKWRKVTEKEF